MLAVVVKFSFIMSHIVTTSGIGKKILLDPSGLSKAKSSAASAVTSMPITKAPSTKMPTIKPNDRCKQIFMEGTKNRHRPNSSFCQVLQLIPRVPMFSQLPAQSDATFLLLMFCLVLVELLILILKLK